MSHLKVNGAKFYILHNVLTDFMEIIVISQARLHPMELHVQKVATVQIPHVIMSMVVISLHVGKLLYHFHDIAVFICIVIDNSGDGNILKFVTLK